VELKEFNDIRYWNELPWYSTGGTRAKKYVQSPDDKFYYFKRSQYKEPTDKKPGKDFRFEFWSEIIAYQVGTALGFDVLEYAIGYDGENLGCISESMIQSEEEQLIEGLQFLQAYMPEYDPAVKEHQKLYCFQAIEEALDYSAVLEFIDDIVQTIIFDSIIGNGDRHQENWALILEFEKVAESLTKFEYNEDDRVLESTTDSVSGIRFAPIYDNGSSLGRELTDSSVQNLLSSETAFQRYISKGLSEIHWEEQKVGHFDLIQNLIRTRHRDVVNRTVDNIVRKFDAAEIEYLVNRVDIWVPEFVKKPKIPEDRKRLITKIILSRVQKLISITNARIR
jgi:hypothetical protein